MSYRPERLAEEIKKEVSELLRTQLKDPRLGFVSVTGVDVSLDLRYAKIYTSILGTDEEQKATMGVLQKAQGFIRSELGGRIRLRHVPEITFKLDQSISRGVRIMELLERVKDPEADRNE